MDAKMRASFINSVGSGQQVPCPSCNTLNNPEAKFCITCGHSLKDNFQAEMSDVVSGMVASPEDSRPLNSDADIPAFKESQVSEPVFNTAKQPVQSNSEQHVTAADKLKAFKAAVPEVIDTEETPSVFADGLPAWDVVPPQIMVRRKTKR